MHCVPRTGAPRQCPWLWRQRDAALVLQPVCGQLYQCPICRQRHLLCTGLPPRETQDEDLTLVIIRILAIQNVCAPQNPISCGDRSDIVSLEALKVVKPPPARPPFRQAR